MRCVQFLRSHSRIAGPSVPADDVGGVMSATRHLLEGGHRRIGYVGIPETLSTGKGRVLGFRRAFEAAKQSPDGALVRFGPATPEFGRDAVHDLLTLAERPSALVVASPRIMLGAIETIEAMGVKVPSELSIVAYSDSDWFRIWRPPITAVALPVHEMATMAAQLLFAQIANRAVPTRVRKAPLESMLKVRASTCSLPFRHGARQGTTAVLLNRG